MSPRIKILVVKRTPRLRADALLVPVAVEKGKPVLAKSALAEITRGWSAGAAERVADLVRRYHGAKKAGAVDDAVLPDGAAVGRVALVCAGESGKIRPTDIRNAAGLSADWCARHGCKTVVADGDALRAAVGAASGAKGAGGDRSPAAKTSASDKAITLEDAAACWVEAAELAAYRYTRLKSKPAGENNTPIQSLSLAFARPDRAVEARVRRAHAVALGANLARELGHEPPNVINPVTLADRARAIARQFGLRCTIFDERELKARKMGAFLAVGEGSASPPRMIVLEHRGRRASGKPIVLVGKAVTLDTGGYSIKPAASIPEMKYDKQGGMAVIGTLVAAALTKLPLHVVGVIGAAENMISGTAYRPGDIVTASNGTTIEILNTDAEGRLVLADCLVHATRTWQPAAMIDLATLTGACVTALGNACAGLYANDDKLAAKLTAAGDRTDERLWRMPLWPVYREQIAGVDSDLKNVGGPNAGSCTAAAFLKEFVGEKIPWAHLDIAGTARTDKALPYCPIGATGFGVRLLMDYLHRLGEAVAF